MGLLEALKSEIARQHGTEDIGGSNPYDTAKMVDMDVAGQNLVVVDRVGPDWQLQPPEPTRFEKWTKPDRWALVYPKQAHFEVVSEESIKVMRARFLLLNGWYYRHFHSLSYPTQGLVFERYIRHTFGSVPAKGSPLGKLLGMAGCNEEGA